MGIQQQKFPCSVWKLFAGHRNTLNIICVVSTCCQQNCKRKRTITQLNKREWTLCQ